MKVQEIREQFFNRVCDARNVEYILKTENFEKAFNQVKDEEREVIKVILEACFDFDSRIRTEALSLLKSWIKEQNYKDVSLRDLREKAREIGISNYSRMCKTDLLSRIAKVGNGTPLKNLLNCNGNSHPTIGERSKAIGHSVQEIET